MTKQDFAKSYVSPDAIFLKVGMCEGLLQASPQVDSNETYYDLENINDYFA